MKSRLAGEWGLLDAPKEGCSRATAGEVVHLERCAGLRELLRHAEDRRYPDARGNEQWPWQGACQSEEVARAADPHEIAFRDSAMHGLGSATRGRIEQHRDLVLVTLRGPAAQRVL